MNLLSPVTCRARIGLAIAVVCGGCADAAPRGGFTSQYEGAKPSAHRTIDFENAETAKTNSSNAPTTSGSTASRSAALLTERVELLGEVHGTADEDFRRNDVLFNAGARWELSERFTLLFAAGRSFRDSGDAPNLLVYAGLQWSF
jgi:hypothetical protein